MAPPTDLEAWTALQAHAAELDKVRKPNQLKDAIYDIVSRSRNTSEPRLDFLDFGIIWIDSRYRSLCNKLAEIGPGRETFDIGTYRRLKTSRLEGYWDVMLEDLADWIESFAKAFRRDVTLNDYERILECMPQDRNLKSYRSNLDKLFWHGASSRRTADLLTQLPLNAYEGAYSVLENHPPHKDWKLKEIMSQIHDKGIVCKSVMLHVGLWFNPELEEPANRANVKPSMFLHLKLAFSKYKPHDPLYEDDESWKPQALALQRAVLNFTLEWWPRSNTIIGNLGMLRESRRKSLAQFKNVNDLPSKDAFASNRSDSGREKFQDRAKHVIQEMSSNSQSSYSQSDEESLDDEDEYREPECQTFSRDASILSEHLAIESEEEDIIYVQKPSPSSSRRSKKRKLQHSNADDRHSEHKNRPEKLKKIVKLKVPNLFKTAKSSDTGSSARKRRIRSDHFLSRVHDASTSAMQPPAWNHVDQDTTGRAMEELEIVSNLQDPENRRHAMPQPPAVRSRQPHIPPNHETSTSRPPTPMPAPQSAPQPYSHAPMFGHTPVASSPTSLKSKTELAVEVLQKDYSHKFEIGDLLQAIKFLKTEEDAGIFLTLMPGDLRDRFLQDGVLKNCSS